MSIDRSDEQLRGELARCMVAGFAKCQLIRDAIRVCGVRVENQQQADELRARAPFMPLSFWNYGLGKRGTPVRAFIAGQWPKLHAFLDANTAKPERLETAVREMQKLKAADRRWSAKRSASDAKEIHAASKELQAVTTANRAARKQQLSHQRGSWSTCKP